MADLMAVGKVDLKAALLAATRAVKTADRKAWLSAAVTVVSSVGMTGKM